MLKRLALWATMVVALLHLAFMVLEATQWSTELGLRLTHLSASAAGESELLGLFHIARSFAETRCPWLLSPPNKAPRHGATPFRDGRPFS